MIPMAEVEAQHVHACINQLAQSLLTPAGGASSADDLGPAAPAQEK
jgi:hypothetical protein